MPELNLGDLTLTSPAFTTGQRIPDEYTGNGEDRSPALSWAGAPEGTREFALVCHDPDAPLVQGFTHWVLAGIPANESGIPEGGGEAFVQGQNSLGNAGYNGPAPPPGHGTHHYFFWVYALDTELGVRPGVSADELLAAMEGHVLEQARLVGTYDN